MSDMTTLLIMKIMELFVAMLMGWTLVKAKILKSTDSTVLSIVVLYLVTPCVIITACQVEYDGRLLRGLLLSFGAAILVNGFLMVFAGLTGRLLHLDPVEKASVMYSNAGNLIIPIVTALFGGEWVIYTIGYIVVQTVLLWTHGRMALCGEKKLALRYLLCNVNIIAILLGLAMLLLRIRLPEILLRSMTSVGGTMGPLAMIIAGMLIADIPLRSLFTYKRIHLVLVLRLIVASLLVLLILKYSGIAGLHPDGHNIVLISMLAAITPVAAAITQMALIYGKDAEYASAIYALTTICCIVTMPLIFSLY